MHDDRRTKYTSTEAEFIANLFYRKIPSSPWSNYDEGGVRVCGDAVLLDFWCGFSDIFILSCGIAVLQNQAVCGIQKFSGNSTAVSSFLMLFCAVFVRNSVRFCGIRTPLTHPSMTNCHTIH